MHLCEINKHNHEINVYFRQRGINCCGRSVVVLFQLLHDGSFSRYKHGMKVELCTYLTNVKPQILFISTPFFQRATSNNILKLSVSFSLLHPREKPLRTVHDYVICMYILPYLLLFLYPTWCVFIVGNTRSKCRGGSACYPYTV